MIASARAPDYDGMDFVALPAIRLAEPRHGRSGLEVVAGWSDSPRGCQVLAGRCEAPFLAMY